MPKIGSPGLRLCEICKRVVDPKVGVWRYRTRRDMRFCSKECYYKRSNNGMSPEQMFWSKVNKDGTIHPIHGQCWEWTGWLNEKGYGYLEYSERGRRLKILAHRFSWEIAYSPIENELCVLHRCDNSKCVNPTHLFLGTKVENNWDMADKKRHQYGERHCFAKLTVEKILEARRRYIPRSRVNSISAMAREFGVSPRALYNAVFGRTWVVATEGLQ